jgi:hypothetical protein
VGVNTGKWGAKIGPRIAMLVSQAMVHTHHRLAALKHKVAMSVFHAISNEISDEAEVTIGPIIAKMHDQLTEDHPAYPLIHFMHTQRGQLKAIVGTGASMTGLLSALGTVMNNELAPVVYTFVASNPHLVPQVGDIANMAATGIVGNDLATSVMASNGFDGGWAANYLDLALNYPSYTDGLEMLRRGLITDADMTTILQRNGIPESYWGPLNQLRNGPVSVADAALGVLRGDLTMDQGAEIAAQNGFDLNSFNTLISNTGEPPGTEQLLEAKRRGFIDNETLVRGILQSRVRNEWIPTLEKLAYTPMSVADAVNAVVQDQMTMAQGEQIANWNGLESGDFDTLYNTAGEPLSRTELQELYNRGLISEDILKQGLRESRLKNKYVDIAFDLHTRIVPIYTLQRALRYGGINQADAIKIAMESGYSESDATLIVNSGSAERLQTYKDKVVQSVQTMYEDGIIAAADAQSVIVAMGYSQTEASFIFESSNFHRTATVLHTIINALHTKYLGRHIPEQQVINDMNALGIPTEQRDYLINLWNIEYGAYTKLLTEAQIVKAATDSLITEADGLQRLMNLGYNQVDATLLLKGA